jgi:hypothetical protein
MLSCLKWLSNFWNFITAHKNVRKYKTISAKYFMASLALQKNQQKLLALSISLRIVRFIKLSHELPQNL